jgi:parvulin-like peptidyl-prolyl isomerase
VVQLAPSTRYSEPIASSFGWHRVRLVDVAPGGALPFEAVQRQIAFDLALQRRQDAIRRFLDDAAARYELVVAGARLSRFEPPMRVARHEIASGED